MQPRPQGAFPGFGGGAARPAIFRFLFSSLLTLQLSLLDKK